MNNVPTSLLNKTRGQIPIPMWIGLGLFLLHSLLLSIPAFSDYALALGHRGAELIYASLVALLALHRYRQSNKVNQQFFGLCLLLAALVW